MAFKLHALTHGIKICAYHADNGIFKANAWVNHCNQHNQAITFAAVNAHHQNGIAERRIRELQNTTRTMLIHAAKRWPGCITANLWPYALKQACEIHNNTPSLQDHLKGHQTKYFLRQVLTSTQSTTRHLAAQSMSLMTNYKIINHITNGKNVPK